MIQNITVIVRSIGERTESLCLHRLAQEIPLENICILRDIPLLESTVLMCHKAIEMDNKYTVMFDADYIPRIGWAEDLLTEAEKHPYNQLGYVKGTIIDKFVMEKRGDQGGPMMYPTWILGLWLDVLNGLDNRLTPEASCQGYFANKGMLSVRTHIWLVLHGYEQDYRDIYRSCFIYGQKLKGVRELLPRWENLAETDKDFKVAVHAYKQGMNYPRHKMEAHPEQFFDFDISPFAGWKKDPITDLNFNIDKYKHLQYKA